MLFICKFILLHHHLHLSVAKFTNLTSRVSPGMKKTRNVLDFRNWTGCEFGYLYWMQISGSIKETWNQKDGIAVIEESKCFRHLEITGCKVYHVAVLYPFHFSLIFFFIVEDLFKMIPIYYLNCRLWFLFFFFCFDFYLPYLFMYLICCYYHCNYFLGGGKAGRFGCVFGTMSPNRGIGALVS